MTAQPNRREFLELTSAGLLAASAIGTVQAAPKSANDKLVVGLIGCGGRGNHDAGLFRKTPDVERLPEHPAVDEDRGRFVLR